MLEEKPIENLLNEWNKEVSKRNSEYTKKITSEIENRRLLYLKNNKKERTDFTLNVGFILPKTNDFIKNSLRPAILSAIFKVLPEIYKTSSYARELLGAHRKFIDNHRNIFKDFPNVPAIVGLDTALYQEPLDVKILEINMNAVVSLGYVDPMIDIWENTFNFSNYKGKFRRLGCAVFKELTRGEPKNIVILTIEGSKTYYEELNQKEILQFYNRGKKVIISKIEDLSYDNNNIYVKTHEGRIKVDIIKRAISGSIIARDYRIWKSLEEISQKNVSLINPLEGLLLKSKISLHLLKAEPLKEIVVENLSEDDSIARGYYHTLQRTILETDVIISGEVFTLNGECLSLDKYFQRVNYKKLVFKDSLGGGAVSHVIFGSSLRRKNYEKFIKILEESEEPWVVQPYIRLPRHRYFVPSLNRTEELKEMTKIFLLPSQDSWWGQLCLGKGPNISFANYSIPLYYLE